MLQRFEKRVAPDDAAVRGDAAEIRARFVASMAICPDGQAGPEAAVFVEPSDGIAFATRNLDGGRWSNQSTHSSMIPLVIENRPYRPLADPWRTLVRHLARHGATF